MSDLSERDKLLLDWRQKKAVLDVAKFEEMQARKQIVDMLHDPARTGSTETTDLGAGYKLKIKVPIRYSFVKNSDGKIDRALIDSVIDTIESDNEYGELVAKNIIRWNPELSLTEYKNLPVKYRLLIDDVLVTSEGAPTVELVEP